jgi:hypothetical protein
MLLITPRIAGVTQLTWGKGLLHVQPRRLLRAHPRL